MSTLNGSGKSDGLIQQCPSLPQ